MLFMWTHVVCLSLVPVPIHTHTCNQLSSYLASPFIEAVPSTAPSKTLSLAERAFSATSTMIFAMAADVTQPLSYLINLSTVKQPRVITKALRMAIRQMVLPQRLPLIQWPLSSSRSSPAMRGPLLQRPWRPTRA